MDALDELCRKIRVPDCDLVGRYIAGIPVYRVRFRASILRTKHLPTIEEFVLRLIGDGVTSQATIAECLGLDIPFVGNALGYLNLMNLVTLEPSVQGQRPGGIKITPRGQAALNEQLSSVETETMEALVDGLTGECLTTEGTHLQTGAEMKKMQDYCLVQVAAGNRPSLKSLNGKLDQLQEVLREHDDAVRTVVDQQFRQTSQEQRKVNQIIEVVELSDSFLQYKPTNVLIFRSRDSGHIQLRVFEGYHPVPEYEERLTAMLRTGRADIVPQKLLVRASEIVEDDDESEAMGADLAAEMQKAVELSDALANVESKISSVEERILATEHEESITDEEMTAKSKRINELESEVKELREEKSKVETELAATRIVFDFEHRDLLKQTLTGARKRAIIISPRITRYAVDAEIIKLIKKCVKSGVLVAIAYGMRPSRHHPNQIFLDPDVEEEFKKIWSQPQGSLLHVENTAKTHEKILICDDRFCVVSSNNFLSFNGDYRIKQETGFYSETKAHIKALQERAQRTFKNLPKDSGAAGSTKA